MPSISPCPSLTVAFRRAEMTAFWILTTAILSLALGLASAALGAQSPWVWAASGLCVLAPGAVWPPWFEVGVRAWNKGVRLSAAALRAYALMISYYLLFGAVSLAGSSLDLVLRRPEVSRWIPRAPRDLAFGDGSALRSDQGHWYQGLLASAWSPGNRWMICLLPLVSLLILLGDEQQESAPPAATYTLY